METSAVLRVILGVVLTLSTGLASGQEIVTQVSAGGAHTCAVDWVDPQANTGITLPNDSRLKADLTAPRWKLRGRSIQVESRDDIVKRLGRSPDWASAYILALIDTPKIGVLAALTAQRPEHDPRKPLPGDYNPYAPMIAGAG